MHTPGHNPSGYSNAAISDMASFQENMRFLVMHGASDDNVHLQSTLVLLDKLDVASVDNYDVHVFPDSDHSILFHNAHSMVYGREFSFLPAHPTSQFLCIRYVRADRLDGRLG